MDPDAIAAALYKAVEDCIFRKAKKRDIIDLDIRVSFDSAVRTVNIEVFLDAEDWIDAEAIVEEATAEGMQLADKLMEKQ